MTLTAFFIIWLIVSLVVAVYGRISLREFVIYVATSLFFIVGLAGIFYLAWNVLIVPSVSLLFPSMIHPSSFENSVAYGSICVWIYSIKFLWFKTKVRKSDKQKLTEVMEGLKEVKSEIDNIVLSINRAKRESNEPKDVSAQLSEIQAIIHDLEKSITPWLLNRL